MPKNTWNVRNRITLPMVASLAFLLAVSLLNIYLFNRDKLTEDIIHEAQEFHQLLPPQLQLGSLESACVEEPALELL